MLRLRGAEISVRGGTVISLYSTGVTAATGSKGYYILSNVGAGAQSLVLVGDVHQITAFLWERKGIQNVRGDDPAAGEGVSNDIYAAGGSFSPSKKAYQAINPLLDGTSEVVKSATTGLAMGAGTSGLGPASDLVSPFSDVGMGIADQFSNLKKVFGRGPKRKPPKHAYLHFTGYPWDGNYTKVGSRKLRFEKDWKKLIDVLAEGL